MKKRRGKVREASPSELLYDDVVRSAARIEAEKAALRTPRLDSERHRQLGVLASGWPMFSMAFRDEFLLIWKCGIRSADSISRTWNAKGFKTGSGQIWSADLVNFAREHLFRSGLLRSKN